MTREELLANLKEWLGEDGINLFKEYKGKYNTVSPIFSVELKSGSIPHCVHFREGMQVRNFLRTQEYCKNWDCHELDNTWKILIEEAINA